MISEKDGARMRLIPAGEFQMGDPFGEGDSDERPVHTVYLDAFYIDVYEVTNAMYKKFMDETGHSAPGYWNDARFNQPNQPVVGVTWYDAAAYCQWAGKRLPTEAEWEKAARGGLVGKRYPWGDSIDNSKANYNNKVGQTTPVGAYPPNGYGLYDMAGNVWEWCLDKYKPGFYAKSPKKNPAAGQIGGLVKNFRRIKTSRVLRGGSWYNYPSLMRVANRSMFYPDGGYNNNGFRCVSPST
jgi:formylglycine-generating enzyme required for sulfatase activity